MYVVHNSSMHAGSVHYVAMYAARAAGRGFGKCRTHAAGSRGYHLVGIKARILYICTS